MSSHATNVIIGRYEADVKAFRQPTEKTTGQPTRNTVETTYPHESETLWTLIPSFSHRILHEALLPVVSGNRHYDLASDVGADTAGLTPLDALTYTVCNTFVFQSHRFYDIAVTTKAPHVDL